MHLSGQEWVYQVIRINVNSIKHGYFCQIIRALADILKQSVEPKRIRIIYHGYHLDTGILKNHEYPFLLHARQRVQN